MQILGLCVNRLLPQLIILFWAQNHRPRRLPQLPFGRPLHSQSSLQWLPTALLHAWGAVPCNFYNISSKLTIFNFFYFFCRIFVKNDISAQYYIWDFLNFEVLMKVLYFRALGRPAVFRKNDFCRLKIVDFGLAKETATCNFTIYIILQAEIMLLHSGMPNILPAVLRKINSCRPYHEVSSINFTLTSLQKLRNRNIAG